MSEEIEVEVVPGVPGALPQGERIVWQGKPEWKALAREAFGVRWVAIYLAVFTGARAVMSLHEGMGTDALAKLAASAILSLVCLGVLSLLAWGQARATVYTLTNRRVVMRMGVAVPMTWNFPFRQVASADMKERTEGDGDIVLQLTRPNFVAWLFLWPHAAPWHLIHARPTLRAIAEPKKVSSLLASTIQEWATEQNARVVVGGVDRPRLESVDSVSGQAAAVGHGSPVGNVG